MNDLGEQVADESIEYLTQKINDIYEQAYKQISKKAQKHFMRFKSNYDEMVMKMEAEEISKTDFLRWYRNSILIDKKWNALRKDISNDLLNATALSAGLINGEIPIVFAENYDFAAYLIEKELKARIGFHLYDKNTVLKLLQGKKILLVDIDPEKILPWNEQHIQTAILQGIIQGESIQHLSQRLRQVVKMNVGQSIRTARSTMTSAQNAGRQYSYENAQQLGVKLKKKWLATHDARTRGSHIWLDGQTVDIKESFKNPNGQEIEYPGDPKAPAGDYYNCRCTMIAAIEGHDINIKDRVKVADGLSYDEWKETGLKKLPKKKV